MDPLDNPTKKIQQIQLKFPREYPPNKYMNPYILLAELNKAVKAKYDIEFLHVKYLMSKLLFIQQKTSNKDT